MMRTPTITTARTKALAKARTKALVNRCVALAVVALLVASCKKTSASSEMPAFQVMKPIVKDVNYHNEYVAEILSVQYVEVRSRVKGYIEQVHVDEGQFVHEGQLLFTISSRTLRYELQKAEASVKNAIADLKVAEVELANVRSLAEKNIVSKAELKMNEAKVEALKASVEEAEANKEQAALRLTFSQIKAPYKGIINRIAKKMGSLIDEGEMLTTISDNREVFAYFNLSESDYLTYITTKDQEAVKHVNLILANQTPYDHEGKIEIIESEFDRSTGNIAFRARFPNPEKILKHGANGKVVVKEQLANVLLIPQQSTFEIQDKLFVFVVKQDSTVEQRTITPKMRIPHYFVIESGVAANETIVYEGVQNLREGDKIVPARIEAEKVLSSFSVQ
jgi:membrane fusion protein (multidrug efflux system)